MKTIQIEDKEYILEFTFEAAEHKLLVQKMFNMISGAYLVKGADDVENPSVADMIDGTANMFSDIPSVCNIAFYAGLLENNPVDEAEAKKIMRAYMKANDLSYPELFEEIKEEMEKDGFFRNTGLDKMMQTIAGQEPETEPKKPQDHKKKTTK